jgi:hypothetical protein
MLQVECYADNRGEQTPRAITIDERKVFVEEILDRWPGSDHRYFKLKGDDGQLYVIRQETQSGLWELTVARHGA